MTIRNPGCRFACPGLGAFGLSARAYTCCFAKIVQGECNEVYFNCRTVANLMQRLCKVSAMKFTSIAEP